MHILSGPNSSYGLFTAGYIVKDSPTNVDDLIGLILQEEARLEQEHNRKLVAPLPTPNASIPFSLQVNHTPP